MKILLAGVCAGVIIAEVNATMTLKEYFEKPPEQKVTVLRGRPDRALEDVSQLLILYSGSLNDDSLVVKRAAAQASAFLIIGLQEATPLGKAPEFPTKDSVKFQQALIDLLDHEDAATRSAAVTAIAFSSPPAPEIEKLLLSKVKAEKNDEIAGGMIESMARAGYNSAQFVEEVTNLLVRTTDTRAAYLACKILGHLKDEGALDLLISFADNPSLAQRHAIQALTAYGAKASKAKSVLESLIRDKATDDEIRSLAHVGLNAINADRPQPSTLKQMSLTRLWPLTFELQTIHESRVTAPSTQSRPAGPEHQPLSLGSASDLTLEHEQKPARPSAKSPKQRWWIFGAVASLVATILIVRRIRR